jgi:hypothetical protein
VAAPDTPTACNNKKVVLAPKAMDTSSIVPNTDAEVHAKLARSLVAAASLADTCPKEKRRGNLVPFRFQRKVDGEELALAVVGTPSGDGVFVGWE